MSYAKEYVDFEKKYKEAMNWMRELYPGLHGATKEDAEHYFPELLESEDERIRKMLIEQMERWHECALENNVVQDIKDSANAITWLEQQKERDKQKCKGCFDRDEIFRQGGKHAIEQMKEAAIEAVFEGSLLKSFAPDGKRIILSVRREDIPLDGKRSGDKVKLIVIKEE